MTEQRVADGKPTPVPDDWTNGVIAILGKDGKPAGSAFLVSSEKRLVATCAHVVRKAGWSEAAPETPVQIRYLAVKGKGRFATAVVQMAWYSPPEDRDVAILCAELELPIPVEVLPLALSAGTQGHTVYSFGYPRDKNGRPRELAGEGKIVHVNLGNRPPRVQLNSTDMTFGYSGGPVWDDNLQRVIGLVQHTDIEPGDTFDRLGFLTYGVPVETLLDVCGALAVAQEQEPHMLMPEEKQALRPYLEWVARQTSRLRFGPLDESGREPGQARIGVDDVFVNLNTNHAFVLVRDEEAAVLDPTALGWLHRAQNLILLGDPGSGKTTLLRYLAYHLARHRIAPTAGWLARVRWEAVLAEEKFDAGVGQYEGLTVGHDFDDIAVERLELLFQRQRNRTGHVGGNEGPLKRRWLEYRDDIPVYVELRDFAQSKFDPHSATALWTYVAAQVNGENLKEATGPLEKAAKAGRVYFFLDGVDEVPPERRAAVWQALGALSEGVYGGCRWVATCRILSYDEAETPDVDSDVVTLAPLIQEQIHHFIDSWYTTLQSAGELIGDPETLAHGLITAVERPRLLELARNPMLLTIMALVQTYRGALPEARAQLYQACVEVMLLHWQRQKESEDVRVLPSVLEALDVRQQTVEQLLWRIAWEVHSQAPKREGRADIHEYDVLVLAREHLGSLEKAEKFLAYTEERAHLLVGRGGLRDRYYTFPHRTFQEYLAACHIANYRKLPRLAPKLAAEGDIWREVLNLAAGTLVYNRDGWDIVLLALERMVSDSYPRPDDKAAWSRIWIGGEMAATVGRDQLERDEEIGRDLLERLRRQLGELLNTARLLPRQRLEAGIALAALGDERLGVGTVKRGDGQNPHIIWGELVPAGQYFVGGDDKAYRSFPGQEIVIAHPYHMARYPVTVAQFQCFVDAEDFKDPRWWEGMPEVAVDQFSGIDYLLKEVGKAHFPHANHPRETVSWYQAIAFCRWLSERQGYYVDLPHEFEWEVAARYPDRRFYPWKNEFDSAYANTRESGLQSTSAVGMYPGGRNEALNLYDLSGNVWEWCRNKYRSVKEYEVDTSGHSRAVRGGSWLHAPDFARAAFREYVFPYTRLNGYGFRLVRRPPSQ